MFFALGENPGHSENEEFDLLLEFGEEAVHQLVGEVLAYAD